MHWPGIYVIGDPSYVGSCFLLKLDGGVEVAAALEIVEKVALSFIEKIVVESIFLIDRDFSFQNGVADVKTLGNDEHNGSGFDQIGVVDGI